MRGKRYLPLLPALAILLAVEVYPLSYTLYLSVIDYGTGSFIGAQNYVGIATSGYFALALLASLAYSLGSTGLALVLGVLFAFQVSKLKRARRFMEGLLLAPLAAAPILAGILWAPEGVWDDFNTFIHYALGQPFFNPTASNFFFPVMIVSDAWEWYPLIMLVALGLMASIPKEVYEAADVSGATAWQTFRRVTLPTILRSPVMQFVVVIRFIDGMRAFEVPFAWSTWVALPQAGSPVDTVSLLLFKLFTIPVYNFPIGEISAMATALLAATLLTTALLFRLMKRSVNFDG